MLAGIAKTIITPRVGAVLVDYYETSVGVHDDLCARALVIDDGATRVALCSVELIWLGAGMVNEIRLVVAARTAILPDNISIFCTHTHSGPRPHHPTDWDRPLVSLIADAIVEADAARQPARMGFGFGQLFGYNINRRWLNRPADPSVAVMRIDRADGSPLAALVNYGCHAVVMGVGNRWISGDFPGYTSRLLEESLGVGAALYSQGGAGDVNPLTESVRHRLAAGHPVGTIGHLTSYYGADDPSNPNYWNIEDRIDGSFAEAETIGRALHDEAQRVWKRLEMSDHLPLWVAQTVVPGKVGDDEPPAEGSAPHYRSLLPEIPQGDLPLEIMLVGIGDAVLVSQPGEVFSETAVAFRQLGQQIGYRFPILISYANGTYAYLPPASAFDEGGYEVSWPLGLGISRHHQSRITAAILPILKGRAQ